MPIKLLYRVKCPKCKAGVGKPCVYVGPMPTPIPSYRNDFIKNGRIFDRVGEPTRRPHNERYVAAAQYQKRMERLAMPEPTERDAIIKANAHAIWSEHQELVDWLRQNAHILTGEG